MTSLKEVKKLFPVFCVVISSPKKCKNEIHETNLKSPSKHLKKIILWSKEWVVAE